MQSLLVLAQLEVGVADVAVQVGDHLHLVGHGVVGVVVDCLQALLGSLQAGGVLAGALGCNTSQHTGIE